MHRSERIKNIIRKKRPRVNTSSGYRLDMAERLLDFNDNFFKKFINTLEPEDISVYPKEELQIELKEKLAKINGVNSENIFLENGSDTVIKNIIHSLVNPNENILITQHTFPMYKIYAEMFDVNSIEIPFNNGINLSVDDIFNKINDKTRLIFLANPNSPYGDTKTRADIDNLAFQLEKKKIYLIIDEAYVDFFDDTMCSLIYKCPNIIFTKTFSKAWGCAGIRLGYGLANIELCQLISKVSVTYPISNFSLKFGIHVCNNIDTIIDYSKNTIRERDELIVALRNKGYNVLDTHVNTLHIQQKKDNNSLLCDILKKHNVSFKTGSAVNTLLSLPIEEKDEWIIMSIGEGIMEMPFIKEILSS